MIDTAFNFIAQALKSGVNHEGPITYNTETSKSSFCSVHAVRAAAHQVQTVGGQHQ